MQHSESCASAQHPCLSCKLGAWRDGSSSLGVAIPVGWKGPSVYELERRHTQELKDADIEFDRAPK